MKIIRCLSCNKVLGEVEGKARIKCKMAGCHCMNVIDTGADTQAIEQQPIFTPWTEDEVKRLESILHK